MLDRQYTLAAPVKFIGVGLHTGVTVNLTVAPAPANTGIVFKRTDLEDFLIKARAAHVARVSYATSLMRKGVLISTTEHLLSALSALGVDNAYAEIDNLEVPIMDGSALPFARAILNAGLKKQRARRTYIRILKPVEISEGAKRIAIYPSEDFRITYSIVFAHPLIGKQSLELTPGPANYVEEIAPARTFISSLEEVEVLKKAGLVRGGSLENALVLSSEKVLNPEGLRFADEFCRHKALDLIGDLALLGHPLKGHVTVERGGHALHYALVSRLLEERASWRLVDGAEVQPKTSAA
ncbi:MAG TPA: UDP-3-O-acyl-N-acetylglucosamine deacetylase [Terriglobia bacterium]|nr:UDP-3-O-acyl-N-acetylglucosamine deacetylase [Terriglobia bacterium]